MNIGVLALQGGYDLHCKHLSKLGANPLLIKNEEGFDQLEGLIVPGGESTALLRLCSKNLKEKIVSSTNRGLPIFTTCAGTILISNKVSNPEQDSLGILDIEIERNGYGRQINSFITKNVSLHSNCLNVQDLEAVFIRAPRIKKIAKDIKVLASFRNDPILVQYKNIIAATFHPELSLDSSAVHAYFVQSVLKNRPH